MRINKPTSKIKNQPQQNLPIVSDTTLVDDPVALVDDVLALVGGQTTTNTNMMINMKTPQPTPRIRKQR